MNDPAIYYSAWLIYLLAGALFYWLFWRVTRPSRRRLLSYCARAGMLSIIVTPWYVGAEGSVLAPALMVVMMDAITISGAAAVRAFIPLLLSFLLALAVAVTLALYPGRSRRRGKPAVR